MSIVRTRSTEDIKRQAEHPRRASPNLKFLPLLPDLEKLLFLFEIILMRVLRFSVGLFVCLFVCLFVFFLFFVLDRSISGKHGVA